MCGLCWTMLVLNPNPKSLSQSMPRVMTTKYIARDVDIPQPSDRGFIRGSDYNRNIAVGATPANLLSNSPQPNIAHKIT